MVKSSVPRGEQLEERVRDGQHDRQADPGRGQAVDDHEAERQRGDEAGHRAADRLAVDVADAPDADRCLPNSEPPISASASVTM